MRGFMASGKFEEIVNDFEFLDDWEDRYGYIIDLGKKLTPLEDSLKNEETKVNGCASQVWLSHSILEKENTKEVFFKGDSDSIIVKGIIAIVLSLFNGKNIIDAKRIDPLKELKSLNLQEHLSSQRSNGLTAMIDKINSIVQKIN